VQTENPFAPLRDHDPIHETPQVREALARLAAGLGAREPFLLVTGEAGSGKTALVRAAAAGWGERATVVRPAVAAIEAGELAEEVVRRLGGEPAEGAGRSKRLAELEAVLAAVAGRGQVAVIVVDDAHDLAPERLEELRLLAATTRDSGARVEVLLAGLPALESQLEDPALAPVRQRVSVRVRLGPLSAGETRRHLHHRVTAAGGDGPTLFPKPTCREVASLAGGIPRRIDVLAHEALRLARAAEQPAVSPEHVREAAAALWGAEVVRDADARRARPAPPATAPRQAAPAVSNAPSPPTPGPKPAAPAAAAAPRATPAVEQAAASDESEAIPHPIPATHDPREWVARFVGDKGPLRLGSRAETEGAWSSTGAGTSGGSGTGEPAWARSLAAQNSRPRPRRRTRAMIGAALAAIVTVGAVVLIVRVGLLMGHKSTTAGAAQAPATAKDGVAQPAAKPADETVKKPGAARQATARPAATPATSKTSRWTIDVGGFTSLDRAMEERDIIAQRTNIEAWVVPAPDGSGQLHRVVLGIFSQQSRAIRAADVLVGNQSLGEAHVVPLPPRRDRL